MVLRFCYMKTIVILSFLLISRITFAYDSNPYAASSAVYKVEILDGNLTHFGTGKLIARNKNFHKLSCS